MLTFYTKNGYVLGETISALQKEIRRGSEEEAMYWALELCPKYENYFWRRIIIIVNEDIGLANPFLQVYVGVQKQLYFEGRERGESPILILSNLILALCRSPKSRLADNFYCAVVQDKLNSPRKEIPDYAIDQHTQKGRALGRGMDHFFAECVVLNPLPSSDILGLSSDDTGNYEERAKEYWTGKKPMQKDEPWPSKGKKENPQMEMF